jgi:uncharacterized protein (DUF934 family)
MKFIDPHHDCWHAAVGEDGPMPTPDPCANRLLSLEQWHAVREHWPRDLRAGVSLPNDVDVESLAPDLPRLALIALHFPKWVDGRAYSQARVLRSRLHYQGEVRATGDVLVDMLPLLQRTGFDAVQLRGDQRIESAQRALGFFAGHYQGDVKDTQPHFARGAS